jgi:hypothetical protein
LSVGFADCPAYYAGAGENDLGYYAVRLVWLLDGASRADCVVFEQSYHCEVLERGNFPRWREEVREIEKGNAGLGRLEVRGAGGDVEGSKNFWIALRTFGGFPGHVMQNCGCTEASQS